MTDKHTADEIQKEFDAAVKNFQAQEIIRDAAPDLLEALRGIVGAEWMVSHDWGGDRGAVLDKAKAAINKATGEKP